MMQLLCTMRMLSMELMASFSNSTLNDGAGTLRGMSRLSNTSGEVYPIYCSSCNVRRRLVSAGPVTRHTQKGKPTVLLHRPDYPYPQRSYIEWVGCWVLDGAECPEVVSSRIASSSLEASRALRQYSRLHTLL